MNDIQIRPATLNDLPTLLEFEQGVIRAERPYDPTIQADPIRYYDLPFLINSPTCYLVVAERNGTLIASGYARIQAADRPYLTYQQHAYLGFMYTDPAHRGKGINKLIIAALEEWAAGKGLKEMTLEVYYDNQQAIRAYEKSGMTRHLVRMRKPITTDPEL